MRKMRYSAGAVSVLAASMLASLAMLPACSGRSDDDDTPPPPRAATVAGPGITPPPPPVVGTAPVAVTVVANSTPPGALVTGGGRQLGTTPLQTQVPVPAPQPGQVQTFAFTFQLEGYQTATINASPVNNTISITAALAPNLPPQVVVQPEEVGGTEGGDEGDGEPNTLRINGQGGGPIFDNHTTTGFAVVNESCTIDTLTVTLSGRHTYYRDLHITLRDPRGNSYSIARGGTANPFRSHSVRRARGRQAQGRWTLAIADRLAQDSGNLNGWSMRIRCR